MKKVKLLHITSSLKMGGAETILVNLIAKLGTDRFEHLVLYFHDGPHRKRLQEQSVSVQQINGFFCRYDPIFLARVYQAIRSFQPDCIHSMLWAANLFSRFIGKILSIKTICVVHNNVDQDGMIRNVLSQISLYFGNTLVAVSPGVADSIRRNYKLVKPKTIKIITNGIDVNVVTEKATMQKKYRNEFSIPKECFVIGSVGRFESVKNYPLCILSFARLVKFYNNTHLMLIGCGSKEPNLRQLVKKLKIEKKVTFVVGKQAYGYYQLFDCFVQTSNKEGISIALLEAMSLGVPCVVTTTESHHPVIKHSINGLLAPAQNHIKLFDSFKLLIDDKGLQMRLSRKGQKTISTQFNSVQMIKQYESLFVNSSIKRDRTH